MSAKNTCPQCSCTADSAQDKFCENCGFALTGSAVRVAQAAKMPSCPYCQAEPFACDADGFCGDCGKRLPACEPEDAEGGASFEADSKFAFYTHIGRRHHVNQDACAIDRFGEWALAAVADGVSSSHRGEDASAAAVGAWLAHAKMALAAGASPAQAMGQAIMAAHRAATALDYNPGLGMDEPESTIVAAIAKPGQATLGWVGDSRAYSVEKSLNGGRLLTRDDSWLASAIDAGIPEREANDDPQAHAITQCLGTRDEDPEPHVSQVTLAEGEGLLLCSDGLWNYFSEPADIASSVKANSDSALGACRELCGRSNAAGGRDNISVALWRP